MHMALTGVATVVALQVGRITQDAQFRNLTYYECEESAKQFALFVSSLNIIVYVFKKGLPVTNNSYYPA
jgi:hypothetical protein